MAQTLISFDYAALGKDASSVRESTVRIKALQRSASESIVEIGKELIEVKDRLAHKQFTPWIEAEFGWEITTAQRFMRVASVFGDKQQIAVFGQSALYLLASPSTPDEAVQEAVERAGQGEKITHAVAKEIVQKHKEPEATKAAIPVHAELVTDDDDVAEVQSILAGKAKRPAPEPATAKQPDYMTEIYLKIKDTVEAIDKKYPGQQEMIRYCLQKVMDYYT